MPRRTLASGGVFILGHNHFLTSTPSFDYFCFLDKNNDQHDERHMARIRHGKQRESLEKTKLVNAHRLTKGLFRCISHTLGRNTRDDFSTLLFWFQRRSTLYKHVDSRALVTGTSFIAAKEVTAHLWFSNSRTVHGRLTAEPWHQETTMSPKRIRHHSSEIRQK